MISLARKNLLHEKLRFLISIGGVGFSVMLILIILSLYRGWNDKLGRYVENVDADVWVVQSGAKDMFHSTSLFPLKFIDELKNVEGVESVRPLIGRRLPLEKDGVEAMLIMIGYDTEEGTGGPSEIVKGNKPQSNEIILDETTAKNLSIQVGEELEITDKKFRVAGLSRGGNVITFQYAFMPVVDAEKFMQMGGLTNYALVSFAAGVDAPKVKDRIEQNFSDLDVLSKNEFADNNRKQIMEAFLPIIKVLVVIGFIVGLVVISLTIYTATIEKSREYGMLKALGARNRHLYRIIFTQSAIAGVFGFIFGVGLTFFMTNIIAKIEPSFVTSIVIRDITNVFGMTLLMIFMSAFIPIRRIVSIDPAIVFKT